VNCPAPAALTAWVDGDVTIDQHRRLTEHASQCPACAAHAERLRVLTMELRTLQLAPVAPGFSDALARKLTPRAPRRLMLMAAGIATCAALLALTASLDHGHFAARGGGGAALRDRLGFEVYVHEAGRDPVRLAPKQQIRADASYTFVVLNRSHRPQQLALFALDASAELHWFYPAFLKADSDPQSIVVPASPEIQALAEGVTPEGPAQGPISFVGVFSATPLHVSDVEARIRAGGLKALIQAFPAANVVVLHAELRAP
jgi:hypothetical protein